MIQFVCQFDWPSYIEQHLNFSKFEKEVTECNLNCINKKNREKKEIANKKEKLEKENEFKDNKKEDEKRNLDLLKNQEENGICLIQ